MIRRIKMSNLKEDLQKKISNLRKEYNRLEKQKEKQEDNDIFDPVIDKQIDDIYEEIANLEKQLEDM